MYVLLVANVIFYLAAGFDQFLVLLLATAVSYVVACKMGKLHEKLEKQKQEEGLDRKQIKRMKAKNKKQRKRILGAGAQYRDSGRVQIHELLTEDRLFYSRSFRDRTRR